MAKTTYQVCRNKTCNTLFKPVAGTHHRYCSVGCKAASRNNASKVSVGLFGRDRRKMVHASSDDYKSPKY